MKAVIGFVTFLIMVQDSLGCKCALKNFKFNPCSKKNAFYLKCSTPKFQDGCAMVNMNCTTDNTLGSITSADLTIEGIAIVIPITFRTPRACQEPAPSSKKTLNVIAILEQATKKVCDDLQYNEFVMELPLGREERVLIRAITGLHRYTLRFKKLNGDPKNELCLKIEGNLVC